MKKLLSLFVMLACVFVLTSCGKINTYTDKEYYAVANLGASNASEVKMEAINSSDKRVKSIKSSIKSATFIYIAEINLSKDDTLSVKRVTVSTSKTDFNAQDKLSGAVKNLSEDLLFVPEYTEFDNGNGTFEDLAKVLVSGSYYVVFAENTSNEKFIALISK